MIKVGMLIAERYEIIEKIGTGGMSDVYRAKDHKLNRFVAVKVLKQEFSENSDFVSKFRVEAQAAAGLMHPNIVNVYDVGEESGFHYIVMELVEGITLKKYIEKKARLSVKEAVSIAIQVAMGIEAAHNNHIIHRDIKPQNIIISKEGKVKVTDFGIAKAATSNTITSNVMGSVHYTSPEQVRGGFSDEKSDIYSLGITLFEMLTGRVPFNGETTVAVAIKHIQEPMPSPRDFVPEIPVSVEQIVMKATQKSPDRRYQNAPEMIEDLKKSLINPDENFVHIDEPEVSGATKDISNEELNEIKAQTRRRDNFDAVMTDTDPRKSVAKARSLANEEPYDDTEEYQEYIEDENGNLIPIEEAQFISKPAKTVKEDDKKNSSKQGSSKSGQKSGSKSGSKSSSGNKKKSKKTEEEEFNPKAELLTTILIVAAVVIIGCIFLYLLADILGITAYFKNQGGEVVELGTDENADPYGVPTSVSSDTASDTGASSDSQGQATVGAVPDVVGKTKAEATATLENEGFVVLVSSSNSSTVEKNTVISQSPEAGSSADRGSTVTINVSLGSETVAVSVPNVIGMPHEDAMATLVDLGLDVSFTTDEYSDTVPIGMICYQSYSAGLTVNTGTTIELRTSKGVEPAYYNCNMSVPAPSDYAGNDAVVTLKGSDGSQLFQTTTSSFPVTINVSNIYAMSTGELTITYNVNNPKEVTDADGNVTMQDVIETKTQGPTTVTFTKVQ